PRPPCASSSPHSARRSASSALPCTPPIAARSPAMPESPHAATPTPEVPDWMRAQLADHREVAERAATLLPAVRRAADALIRAFTEGGILYTFGNGGSAADAQHFTGELIGHYKRDRRPLPAVTLSTDTTTMTCIANDYSFDDVFARQVQALARPADVVA